MNDKNSQHQHRETFPCIDLACQELWCEHEGDVPLAGTHYWVQKFAS